MNKPLLFFLAFLIPYLTPAQNLLIRNITIVNVKTGKLNRNKTVLIQGNRISSIVTGVATVKSAKLIDGTGKFLIPGLWDMHAHTLTDKRYQTSFPLMIANGVTGVREMGNNLPIEEVNQMRKDIEDGKVVGPRLGALTYKIMDGAGTQLGVANAVANVEEAKTLVKLYKDSGADFVKPYNLLTADVYKAIMEEAKQQHILVEGHVPFSMTALDVSELGQKTIEHNFDILVSCSSKEDELRKGLTQQNWGQAEAKAAVSYDQEKANKIFKRLAYNGTWSCPTIAFYKPLWLIADETEVFKDTLLQYISKAQVNSWHTPFQRLSKNTVEEFRKQHYAMRSRIVKEMHAAGVKVLAGTDAGAALSVPGFSLHQELQAMVDAGLSNLDALRTATLNPAIFLNKEKDFGSIEKGKFADLVLLDANPLENIGNTKRIYAVIANGKLLERKDLDQLLAEAEEAAGR